MRLAFFGAEEPGELGSRHHVAGLSAAALARIQAMVNYDTVAGGDILYVHGADYTINGKSGYDGYSQTTHPALWDCYDAAARTACDRASETRWGKVWHTRFDRLYTLNAIFPGRVARQLADAEQGRSIRCCDP